MNSCSVRLLILITKKVKFMYTHRYGSTKKMKDGSNCRLRTYSQNSIWTYVGKYLFLKLW